MVRIDRGLVDKNIYASQEELYWIEEYGGGGGKNKNEKRKLREQQQQTKGKIQQRSTQGNHCMWLKKMSRNGLLYLWDIDHSASLLLWLPSGRQVWEF